MVDLDSERLCSPIRDRSTLSVLQLFRARVLLVLLVLLLLGGLADVRAQSLLDEEDPYSELDDSLLGGSDAKGGADDLLGGESDPFDLGGSDEDDPLSSVGPDPEKEKERAKKKDTDKKDEKKKKDPHEDLWTENQYPSAESCRKCHPGHYDEWAASSHGYAAISPMFQRFEQAMHEYTRGTVGFFCTRCHSPIQTQLSLPREMSVLDAPPVVREGVTCIACHRVNEHYWRSNGDRRIEPGDIHQPMNTAGNGAGVAAAVTSAKKHKLKLYPGEKGPGQNMHRGANFFAPLKTGDICVSCHQVAVHPGIGLEVVHAQYRASPASKRGVTCQQCHMGAVPGKESPFATDHIAEIGGKPYGEPKKRSNHMFWGPGYSIAHPGLFPHNPKAKEYEPRDWLAFDYRSGWGTEAFEKTVPKQASFPKPWDTADDRRDARKIIDKNLATIQRKREAAIMTLEAATKIDGPYFKREPRVGRNLTFAYRVSNTSDGHNLPTGSLGAQPQLWLNVVLIDPDGRRVWESGYLDRNGDLADMHSREVALGRIARDKDLFNLQTKFLINNGLRGTDREAALPLNFSVDQLVFLRPANVPVSVLNHPPLIRMEAHSIAALDSRTPTYHIPAHAFTKPGAYRLSVRMRSRTEPIYFMRQINSTPEMIQRMNENMLDIRPSSHTFTVR